MGSAISPGPVASPAEPTTNATRAGATRSQDNSGNAATDFAAMLLRVMAMQSAVAAEAGDVGTEAADAPPETAFPSDRPVADATRRQSNLDALVPEFRTRLERVIARMEELGHTVQVVETVRDQSRQDFLYAQGRTRSGPVVTWTRESHHTEGRAADLLIDGSYGPHGGYRTLAAIAEQEGLRTLGPQDAGHVELADHPSSRHTNRVAASTAAGSPFSLQSVRAAEVARVANIATAAPVAQVASIASVAQVAQVAGIGNSAGGAAVDGKGAAGSNITSSGDDRIDGAEGRSIAIDGGAADKVPTAAGAGGATGSPAEPGTDGLGRTALERTSDAEIASRVVRVLNLQDANARQPLSSVVLRVGGEDSVDRMIRVARRGNEIRSTIDVTDPLRAQELRGRLQELQNALEAHGLKPELTVQAADAAAAIPEHLRAALDTVSAALETRNQKDALSAGHEQRSQAGHRQDGEGQQRHRPRREHEKQEGR